MSSNVLIDGSIGEGGGQILRTALALSLVTGRSFRIERIRAGRNKPGLLRQHLTAVNAALQISGGDAEGVAPGSTTIEFHPGTPKAGDYTFSVGTAGSTMLVLQTILIPLSGAKGVSRVTLEGGTHNPAAPPFDFLEKSFLPVLEKMGTRVDCALENPGFYPAGGGRATFTIEGSALRPIDLRERGAVTSRRARAVVSNLPYPIAEREIATVAALTGWPEGDLAAHSVKSAGPGNIVTITIESENVAEVVTSFGEKGVRAEAVAKRAVDAAVAYEATGAAASEHLTDQLLLPMAVAGGGSFTSAGISSHTTTNIQVIEAFLDRTFTIERGTPDVVRLT